MGEDHEKGLYSPELMEEIRSRFEYVDWDPYSGKRIYLEAASGSLRPKSVIEAMAKETCLPDQQGRANPGSAHSVEVTAKGIESAKGCELYRGEQLRLHAPGQDPFFAAMLKQLGISSFIRLSACHYNTPEEIELFLKATASFA